MPLKFVAVNDNVFQLLGTSSSDPLPGLRPWTPLGDFRPLDPLACAVLKISFKIPWSKQFVACRLLWCSVFPLWTFPKSVRKIWNGWNRNGAIFWRRVSCQFVVFYCSLQPSLSYKKKQYLPVNLRNFRYSVSVEEQNRIPESLQVKQTKLDVKKSLECHMLLRTSALTENPTFWVWYRK